MDTRCEAHSPGSTVTITISYSSSKGSASALKQQQLTAAAPSKQQGKQLARQSYIDWLRAFVIALVVVFHSIDFYFDYTYSAAVYLGIVNQPPAGAQRQAAIVLAQLMQSFFMGLMFLLSGYFSGPSYDRKGPLRFLADRALRLLLPLLVYDLLMQPLAFEIARHSAFAPPGLKAAPNGFAFYYTSEQFTRLGKGAGWFIAVLFVFDLVYAAARLCIDGASGAVAACNRHRRRCGAAAAAASTQCGSGKAVEGAGSCGGGAAAWPEQQQQQCLELPLALPASPVRASPPEGVGAAAAGTRPPPMFSAGATAAGALAAGVVITGLCLLVRLGVLIPLGLPQSLWVVKYLQFQPAYLPQYVAAFILGLAARRAAHGGGLARLPSCAGPAAAVAAVLLAVAGAALMTYCPGSNFGRELQAAPSITYVAVYTLWEQFYAVSMWLALLVCFRRAVNARGGAVGAAVSGAAYAVYVLHIPVLVALGLAFEGVAWPPAAKWALVTPLAVVGTWLLGMLVRLLPGVKRVV